jgi:thiamine-monophosphate kinase
VDLRDLGEFGLIARIERAARACAGDPAVVVGIGDDAAVLRPRAREDIVVSTDAMVEGVHFRFATESARTVGRRALVASLSDLAAMGARPLGAVLALAAPPALPVRTVDALAAGLVREACEHGCPLVGGNVTRARQVSLTVAVVGAVARGRALRRSGARRGDRICVTGALGAAALALARAERGGAVRRHVARPRLAAGRALGRARGIGGCIDVSDGLAADLDHLLGDRQLAAAVDFQALPRPTGFAAACARLGVDPDRLVLQGGEDYELLFTVRPRGPSAAQLGRRLGVTVTEIGRVVVRGRGVAAVGAGGWRHF